MSPISCIFLYVEKYQNREQWHLLLVTSSNLLPKSVVSWTPFTKITYSLTSTLLLGGVSSEMSEMLAAWLKSSFCTQIKLNSQFSGYAFFFSVDTSKAWSCVRFLYWAPDIWKEIIYQNCINLRFTCKRKTGKTGRHPKRTAWGAEGGFLIRLRAVCPACRWTRWSLQNPVGSMVSGQATCLGSRSYSETGGKAGHPQRQLLSQIISWFLNR